jgi:hypothetical protein
MDPAIAKDPTGVALLPSRVAITRSRPDWTIPEVRLPTSTADFKAHFQDRCKYIAQHSIENLQQLVHDAGQYPEAEDTRLSIVTAGLTKLNGLLHPDSSRPLGQLQAECVKALIYDECTVDMIALAGRGESI